MRLVEEPRRELGMATGLGGRLEERELDLFGRERGGSRGGVKQGSLTTSGMEGEA